MDKEWKDITIEKPFFDGKYLCIIQNGSKNFEAVRMFKRGFWFGGCRPFSDNDHILKWKEIK